MTCKKNYEEPILIIGFAYDDVIMASDLTGYNSNNFDNVLDVTGRRLS